MNDVVWTRDEHFWQGVGRAGTAAKVDASLILYSATYAKVKLAPRPLSQLSFGLLRFHSSLVPVDDVHQLPGIFAEFKLKLTLFVDDQL